VAARLHELLAEGGARIDATYFCADHPEITGPSSFRKPGMGMYLQAAEEHHLDVARSAYIGDKWRDVQPALTAGGLGILIPNGNTEQSDIDRAMLSAHTAADIEQAIGEALVWMRDSD
jgi:histidinol phosphatase-like enzyme